MTEATAGPAGGPATDKAVSDWWTTSIIRMEPGVIEFRGHPIQDLIGNVSFPQMIWLMLRGELPSEGQARLLEAALVASVDHGPQAPSIATARMAITCGVGLNNAMGSAVNVLGDVHGGAGEQLVELFERIDAAGGVPAVPEMLAAFRAEKGKFVPGYGHRFHKDGDPRAPRLLGLVDDLAARGEISGRFAAIARAIEAELARGRTRGVPMNIDGATAVIFAELGFAAPLARGIFCLSRSVGILAHAWEQKQQGGRNKGPMPPNYLWTYSDS
ncbi:citryl-CoA lyase [Pseudooceanicola sp. 200-1SW]|uniref:citryl-CoA lyase n=1 Tax=Pseudooceanicola sp. 200-1SW TaxID=3425949 RepID=UPI003D7F53EF